MRPNAEVAGVLQSLGDDIEHPGLNPHQLRHLSAIKKCRTAALGGHVDKCDDCGSVHISYNSCRNRHCPKCQGHKREEWMRARVDELLPVPYPASYGRIFQHTFFCDLCRKNDLWQQQPERSAAH